MGSFRRQMLGTVQEVLFEEMDGEYCTGHAKNSIRVYLKGPNRHNEVLPVRITGLYRDGLLAEPDHME